MAPEASELTTVIDYPASHAPILKLSKGNWKFSCPACGKSITVAGQAPVVQRHWPHLTAAEQVTLSDNIESQRAVLLQYRSPAIRGLVHWQDKLIMSQDESAAFSVAKANRIAADRTRMEAEALGAWEAVKADSSENPMLYQLKETWTLRCAVCNGSYWVGEREMVEGHWQHMKVDQQIRFLAEVNAKRDVLLGDGSSIVRWLVRWVDELDVTGMSEIESLPFYQSAAVLRRRQRRVEDERQLAARVVKDEKLRAEEMERLDSLRLTSVSQVACPSCGREYSLYEAKRTEHWDHQTWDSRASVYTQGNAAWGAALDIRPELATDAMRIWLEATATDLDQRRRAVWDLTVNMSGFLSASLSESPSVQLPDLHASAILVANTDEWERTIERWWGSMSLDIPAAELSCKLGEASRLLLVSITVPTVLEAVAGAVRPVMILGELVGTASTRSSAERKRRYVNGISEIALASLHRLFAAIPRGHVETIVLNCMVDSVDPATGRDTRECVLSIQTFRDTFENLRLDQVDPVTCVRNLNAAVPRERGELRPVRPLIEFDKRDPRLIEASDVLSTLDIRPNLMDLTPTEFESLIQNLFQAIGLDTHQTQASRDGGVDCIAYDPRPIFGGKVVIQAKRYKNVVGVSAVRDLWGTVMNEGAGKGILVTTSGYGRASYAFAQGKPLELLEGSHLLHLLKEHTGIDARIVVPETWIDPTLSI